MRVSDRMHHQREKTVVTEGQLYTLILKELTAFVCLLSIAALDAS